MPLNHTNLDDYLSSDPHTVVSSIHESLLDWQQLLTETSEDSLIKIVKILEILSSHCQDPTDKQHQIRILTITTGNDRFLQSLKNAIVKWSLNPNKSDCLHEIMCSLHPFINEVLQLLPLLGTDFLSSLVFACIGVLCGSESEELEKYLELQAKIVEISKKFEVVKKKSSEFDGVLESLLDESEAPEDFRVIPIVPSLEELLGDRFPFLRPNKVRDNNCTIVN